MKIAVYTIAKNEAAHVGRWAQSCADADFRFILDTGSTDDTCAIAQYFGVAHDTQVFDPWRFDHARNAALALLPDDIDMCIALDMDEVLVEGWRDALEAAPEGTTRPRYKYVWSWNPDGTEGLVYGGDKIHTRHGYRWKHPVHEVLKPIAVTEQQHWCTGLEIHHHPDSTKSRAQYFDLLKLAVEEEPRDDRNQFYLAREYYFNNDTALAQFHFSQFLKLSMWPPERAAARRYLAKLRPMSAENILYRAVAEDPSRRETWFALAQLYYEKQEWAGVMSACQMLFRIKDKPLDYLCEPESWGWQPHDLMALACYHLGFYSTATEHGEKACSLNPTDMRLKKNLEWYYSGNVDGSPNNR
jgi:tetratricopeptide (TPR) repeat protein